MLHTQNKTVYLIAFCMGSLLHAQDRASIVVGGDPTIKVIMKGRAGNLELANSGQISQGHALTDYQKGSGYVVYDRATQTLTFKPKIPYTLNKMSKHISRVAPFMHAYFPKNSVLDFHLDINSVGSGSLNFADINLSHFRLDARYAIVNISFPSENQSIFRSVARFHVTLGELKINQLANLKASEVRINGGTGDLSVDFGPKLLTDMKVSLDHDIGYIELVIAKGSKVLITGTSRDLSEFGFLKGGKTWEPTSFSPASPTLNLNMKGPLGELSIVWK